MAGSIAGSVDRISEASFDEGRMENQVEVVEGFLRVGVTWDVVEAATGLTENGFQALKAQLAGPDS